MKRAARATTLALALAGLLLAAAGIAGLDGIDRARLCRPAASKPAGSTGLASLAAA